MVSENDSRLIFMNKTFVTPQRNPKFTKVFTSERNPLYGIPLHALHITRPHILFTPGHVCLHDILDRVPVSTEAIQISKFTSTPIQGYLLPMQLMYKLIKLHDILYNQTSQVNLVSLTAHTAP